MGFNSAFKGLNRRANPCRMSATAYWTHSPLCSVSSSWSFHSL